MFERGSVMKQMLIFIFCCVLTFGSSSLLLAADTLCNLRAGDTYQNPHLIDERLTSCKILANDGSVAAQIEISKFYGYGPLDKRDHDLAEKWARVAIESEMPIAYFRLANVLFYKTNPTKKELKEGADLFLKADKLGYDIDLRVTTHFEERFKLQDFPDILLWAKKRAKLGSARMQYFLAENYMEGAGLPQNTSLAIDMYKLLMQQEKSYSSYAPYALGSIYEKGKSGIAVDKKKALEYYEVSAARGSHDAKVKVYRLNKELFQPPQVMPKLVVSRFEEERAPVWVAELYSDGTIDILANYQREQWWNIDFGVWAKYFFKRNNLPTVAITGPDPLTSIEVVELDYQSAGAGGKLWFPRQWYSLKSEAYYEVDRLLYATTECSSALKLVIKGKQPFDDVLYSDRDEERPVLVDIIASWYPNIQIIQQTNFDGKKRIRDFVMSDVKYLENIKIDGLKKSLGNNYQQLHILGQNVAELHIWSADSRDKHRRVEQDSISKVRLEDGSFLYQVTTFFHYRKKDRVGPFYTSYDAWVLDDGDSLSLLDSSMVVINPDWKSIIKEAPMSAVFYLQSKIYAIGGHYAAGKSSMIYQLDVKGAHQKVSIYDARSCE